jgi:acyl dehydratase
MEAHRVKARNDAEHSENKIHDDAVAPQYGFRGGLVPGVTVYGYLSWLPVSAWGAAWLEHGVMSARFVKPVYAGDVVEVAAVRVDDGRLDVTAVNHDGELCATGSAWLPDDTVSIELEALVDAPLPTPERRPPANDETLAPGTRLGTVVRHFGPEERAHYLDLLDDDHRVYDKLGIAHPGALVRAANTVLSGTVRLGPWVHVSSMARHLAVVPDGATVATYGRVVDRYERKGHKFVDLDVVSTMDGRPVLTVAHTAIYEPRRR